MLPEGLWRPWEPRTVFPVFRDAEVTLDFVVQESLRPTVRSLAHLGYGVLRRFKPMPVAMRDLLSAAVGRGIAFRGVFVTCCGEFIAQWPLSPPLQAGEFFSVNINRLRAQRNIAVSDGLFILIASRGRLDRWSTSPGSATIRYVGERFIAGYRTGLFARPLNEQNGKGHFGFTGINPQVLVGEDMIASVLLINHSSDPCYDRPVTPVIRLYADSCTFLETTFGTIPPHGCLERTIPELFPDAASFLASSGGRGFTIAQAPGVSLASIHLLRSRSGRTLGLDHSRPSYANVVA